MQINTIIMEISVEITQKTKNRIASETSPGHLSKGT
jgi:hypothetical protein